MCWEKTACSPLPVWRRGRHTLVLLQRKAVVPWHGSTWHSSCKSKTGNGNANWSSLVWHVAAKKNIFIQLFPTGCLIYQSSWTSVTVDCSVLLLDFLLHPLCAILGTMFQFHLMVKCKKHCTLLCCRFIVLNQVAKFTQCLQM